MLFIDNMFMSNQYEEWFNHVASNDGDRDYEYNIDLMDNLINIEVISKL